MTIEISFKELNEAFGYLNTVFNDKKIKDTAKDVYFIPTEDGVKLGVVTPEIITRVPLADAEVTKEFDTFAINAPALWGILNTYKGLSKTEATSVILDMRGNRVAIDVLEEPIDPEDVHLQQVGHFFLNKTPERSKTLEQVLKEAEDVELSLVDTDSLSLTTDTMMGQMADSSVGGLMGVMQCFEEHIAVQPPNSVTLMKNTLGEVFTDISLDITSVRYLKYLSSIEGDLQAAKAVEGSLYCTQGGVEAFIRTKSVRMDYQKLINHSKDNGFVVNRGYFMDVIRRASSIQETFDLTIRDGVLEIRAGEFNQGVYLENTKGDLLNVCLKLPANVLMGVILPFDDTLFVYAEKVGRSYSLFFQDSTGAWFSNIKARGEVVAERGEEDV